MNCKHHLQCVNYFLCSFHNILLLNIFSKFSWQLAWICRHAAFRMLTLNLPMTPVQTNISLYHLISVCTVAKLSELFLLYMKLFLKLMNDFVQIERWTSPFKLFIFFFVVCFGFYVTSTQYRSYHDVPALLVEEDLRCPSVHCFRHEREPE
jgi:hypothetical protein